MDLLVAGPILLLVSPSTLTAMAVTAGNGGLIPWQSGLATPVGRFQFILGREVGVGIFGYGRRTDRFVVPNDAGGPNPYTLIGLSSIQLDFPLLEYRPFRSFSLDQKLEPRLPALWCTRYPDARFGGRPYQHAGARPAIGVARGSPTGLRLAILLVVLSPAGTVESDPRRMSYVRMRGCPANRRPPIVIAVPPAEADLGRAVARFAHSPQTARRGRSVAVRCSSDRTEFRALSSYQRRWPAACIIRPLWP
jgi:hypothetical protein